MMDAVKFLKVLDKMCDGKCRECEFGEKASRNEPCHYKLPAALRLPTKRQYVTFLLTS